MTPNQPQNYPRSEALEASCKNLTESEQLGIIGAGLRILEDEVEQLKEALIESAHAFDLTVPLIAQTKYDYPNVSCRQGQRIARELLNRNYPGWDKSNQPLEDE